MISNLCIWYKIVVSNINRFDIYSLLNQQQSYTLRQPVVVALTENGLDKLLCYPIAVVVGLVADIIKENDGTSMGDHASGIKVVAWLMFTLPFKY